ncbi:MAG: methyltransferase domain-containing protein [Anaerolineales bacterium]|nr:methyltransferase domain-containing protein [Anaerolineales bacterium]
MIPHDNLALIRSIKERGMLVTPRIIEAFLNVDRVNFISEAMRDETYGDYPLPIGNGQTISQPSTVAFMLELLQAQVGDEVLDIGSGSGWAIALLAYLVGKKSNVIGLERIDSLMEFANEHLRKIKCSNAVVKKASAQVGLPGRRFDAILVSASAQDFPASLLQQLKPNGRLVIPVRNSIFRYTKLADGKYREEEYPGFSFVPLIVE